MTENDIGPVQRSGLKTPDEDSIKTTPVTSRILAGYGAVRPHTRPENFATLREEFETGVAEDAKCEE